MRGPAPQERRSQSERRTQGGRPELSDPLDRLRMVGKLARDDVATVWAEITVAARTDPELADRVEPAALLELARHLGARFATG